MTSAVDSLKTPSSRRAFLVAGALGGATAVLAGCGVAAASTTKRTAHLYLTIATPAMLGNEDPAMIPANPQIPANSTVRVEIVNFDDATPMTAALAQFAKVQGTVGGTITVAPLDTKDPNHASAQSTVSSLDLQSGVSHTFTIAKLGINVPVAPKARTIFTIETGDGGTYLWRCNDPCGTGPGGWGGAMSADGFMMGKLTIA